MMRTAILTLLFCLTAQAQISYNPFTRRFDFGLRKDGNGNYSIGATVLCAAIGTNAGTTLSLAAANNGCVARFTAATDVTLTVPAGLPAGFSVLLVQRGAGPVIPTPADGVTIRQRQGLTKTAGQYAVATLVCDTANDCILSGDLQ
jgi:hypothetical protein